METNVNIIIIPARMASKRFPGKPLEKANGKPLLKWTYEAARKVESASMVVVATSDKEIANACLDLGMNFARVDDTGITTGTQRCARALRTLPASVDLKKVRVVVNWQVDEPMVDPSDVDFLIRMMKTRLHADTKTLCARPTAGTKKGSDTYNDPNVVKVVIFNGRCHWFSRAPMANCNFHIGVYGFNPGTLSYLEHLEETEYSEAEGLEQLAWLQHGQVIRPVMAAKIPLAINTKADMNYFRKLVQNENASSPD